MNRVDAGISQNTHPAPELLGCSCHLRRVVHRLPLRDANDERQLADGDPATADGLRGELRAALDGPAEAIGALVGDLPEEFVDQVGVCAVQLDAVEPELLRVARSVGIGLRHVEHLRLARFLADLLASQRDAGRPVRGRIRKVTAVGLAAHPLMPELWSHLAARGVHRVDDALPPGQRLLPPEERNVRVVRRAPATCERPFGQDEPHVRSRAPAVVGDVVVVREAARRARARHRRHHDAVLELEPTDLERPEERRHIGHDRIPFLPGLRRVIGSIGSRSARREAAIDRK